MSLSLALAAPALIMKPLSNVNTIAKPLKLNAAVVVNVERQENKKMRRRKKSQPSSTERLKSIYYDVKHPAGFASIKKLSKASDLPQSQVKRWLKGQATYTLHKQAKKKYRTRHYIVHDIDEQWQADLCDVASISKHNSGNNFILTVIDIFSRYAWAQPLKTKEGKGVAKAFQTIFREGRIPKRIQSDQGKEFENQHVTRLFERHDIELFSVKSAYKAALVERFNRTLKNRLWRHFTANLTQNWTKVLQDTLHAYNHSIHRSIGLRPVDVNADNVDKVRESFQRKRTHVKSDVKIGDKVRISKVKSVFAKGYLPNWTEEVFTVSRIDQKDSPTTYKLKDYDNEEIEGSFYRDEIEVVTESETYLVEKIIRCKKRQGEEWCLVKWTGYPSSMNSWMRRADIFHLSDRQ
jgi:transposase InsO family protein